MENFTLLLSSMNLILMFINLNASRETTQLFSIIMLIVMNVATFVISLLYLTR